jgi:hypothetical protein
MGAFTTILPAASSSNVEPVLQEMGALTVMSPADAPLDPVVMVTLSPAFNAVSMLLLRMTELVLGEYVVVGLDAAGNAVPDALLPSMVTLYGSSNHVPRAPLGAETLTTAPVTLRL